MSESLGAGTELAGYRISTLLGRGGMGFVYEAEHAILGRKAALKTLAPDLAGDNDFRERFIRESQMVAALDHPSIIPIYDAGEAGGIVYIAMRHVSGGDLSDQIEAGKLDADRAILILEQVAGALDAAHEHGLVHRDVKPANVLLDTVAGRAYLTDFGIAKQARSKGLTRTGFFVGTLDYAAPEQIRGEPVGSPADVYAFGCLLFECLTGKKPFDRATDVAVMHAHLLDERPKISEARADLPEALDEVVARALALDEHARYDTCIELIEAVRACLFDQPLGGAVTPARPATRTATRTAGVLTNFPAEPTQLIGRDRELAAISELAAQPDVRLVTLTGPGGTGKTRLAMAAAAELAGEIGQAFFVDLAPIRDAEIVGSTIAKVMGVEETADLPLVEGIARRLGDRPALLVLDNFEQVLPAASFVHDLLGAVEATAIVTSQAPLRLREEHEFPVPPLSLPDASDGEAIAESAAVALFVDRAKALKPDFELDDENAAAVAGICLRLEGLPLAIELAAARVKLMSPQAILSRLERRLELLTGGASDLPARQRTLRDAIEWSYNLLEEGEQALLARLGIFAGGCSLEVAESVCGDGLGIGEVLEMLASLVDKSLVRQFDGADGEPRFGMFETIREYALERLEERGELDELRRRHAERYLALAEAAEPELLRANQTIWLQRLDEENGNIRGALGWAIGAGEMEIALRLASALLRFWSTRGLLVEGRRWLTEAISGATDVAPELLAKATFAAGYTALGEGDFAEARGLFVRSAALAEEAGDRRAEAAALAQLAWLAMAAGELEPARELAERSTELASETDDKLTASGALGTLAEIAMAKGEYDESVALLERGLLLRRALGDKRLIANSLLGLGRVALLEGRHEQATPPLEEGLALARQVKDGWSISVALANLGRVRLYAGDLAAARELLSEGFKLAWDRNDKRVAAECAHALGAVCAAEARPLEAIEIFAGAETLREATGAVLSPTEAAVGERYLTPLESSVDRGAFETAWKAGRSLQSPELYARALCPPPQRSAETVASPTSSS